MRQSIVVTEEIIALAELFNDPDQVGNYLHLSFWDPPAGEFAHVDRVTLVEEGGTYTDSRGEVWTWSELVQGYHAQRGTEYRSRMQAMAEAASYPYRDDAIAPWRR